LRAAQHLKGEAVLIKSYGLYWSIDSVQWGRKGPGGSSRMDGEARIQTMNVVCDFWNERAVYALFEEYKCIYIGKAVSTPLGQELSNRRRGRFAGRWDTFSWFGLGKRVADKERRNNDATRYMTINPPGHRNLSPADIVGALEALSILLVNPPLNRRHETLKGAHEFDQVGQEDRRTLRQVLGSIEKSLSQRYEFPSEDELLNEDDDNQ
jgi:hypothetical protein